MNSPARKIENSSTLGEYGRVFNREVDAYYVKTPSGVYKSKKAFSCLVEPEINDQVLVSINEPGGCYILAVLDREKGSKAELAFEGDVEIKAPGGGITLGASEGVNLESAGDISLCAPGMSISALEGDVNIEKMSFWSGILDGRLGSVKIIARAFDSIVEKFFSRMKQSTRIVEDMDQLKAGRINQSAEKSLVMRGKFSQLTAEDDVHIDGKQIHIG